MSDTAPSNGSHEPPDTKSTARLMLILAIVSVILGALAVVLSLIAILRDLFEWRLPWSPLAGWILAAVALALALLTVGFMLLRRESVRAFLEALIKDWRFWVLAVLFIALTTGVVWLWFRVGKLNSVLLEQDARLAASHATAAAQATKMSYLASTVSLLATGPELVSPEPTTPIPTGSTVVPTDARTPVPATSTGTTTAASATPPIASSTPRATATSTPSPGTRPPSPTPGPIIAAITTKGGAELELTEFGLYYGSSVLRGYPIQTGVEVNWDYIDRVVIGDAEDLSEIPVTITLVNGEVLNEQMGWKRGKFSAYLKLVGRNAFIEVDTDLWDVPAIDYRWSDPLTQIPDMPPESDAGPAATVITKAGATIDVTGLHFICSDVYPCRPAKTATSVPLELGISPSLAGVKEITFGESAKVGGPFPVTVILVEPNGKIEDEMHYGWRLAGFAALGEFDLVISEVATVTISQ